MSSTYGRSGSSALLGWIVRNYFSNFFQRASWASTFFGEGEPVAFRASNARGTSNTLPADAPNFFDASLGSEIPVFSATNTSVPTA